MRGLIKKRRKGKDTHSIEKEEKVKVKVTIIDYNEAQSQEKEAVTIEECLAFRDTATVTWINVDGLSQIEILEKLGNCFGLHPLVLEDISNTDQRPKIEDYESYIYIVLKMLNYNEKNNELDTEQISLILGNNFVISFQERQGDIFNPIRERIRNAKGRIRKMGPDYLVYALIDAVVDNYFLIMEKFGERTESLEEELVTNPSPLTLQTIHNLKREMIFLRKSVWPLREVVNILERGELVFVKKNTRIFLRDVYDHTIQVIDTIETLRDMISSMLDIYLSSISNRMNEVMKVLTIIATIFIPLTFIAGIYGMNFKYMPELQWQWAYFGVLIIMAAIGVLMLIHFKRKKWL